MEDEIISNSLDTPTQDNQNFHEEWDIQPSFEVSKNLEGVCR
jgi:hypothetical protein